MYQLRRLWGNSVPILSTNLMDNGLIDDNFNRVLTEVAVAAFDNFATDASSSSSSANREEEAPLGRRRRRVRTPTPRKSNSISEVVHSPIRHDDGKPSPSITPNDNFFEFQRTRGYRLATHSISNCDAVRQLEEEHIVRAISHYVLQFATGTNREVSSCMATSIAHQLHQSTGIGLSIDLWAAVQRGRGARHAYHVHEGAIVSGVYYSSCPLGCAPLILRRPDDPMIDAPVNNQGKYDRDLEKDIIEKEDVAIHPKEGQLVLFPPWVSHGVPLINRDEIGNEQMKINLNSPRVSWAFNLTGRLASIGDPWSITQSSSSCLHS
ncbi:hypothetical protein ACHAXR_009858 [Thalassiosira sp. AJA248-18]